MVSTSFTALDQVGDPVFVPPGKTLGISLSGTFAATIAIQRILQSDPTAYPVSTDTGWNSVISYTAGVEQKVEQGEGCWYRGKCTAYTSGTAVLKLT